MQHTCSTAGAVLIVCWDFGLLLYCTCTSSVLQFRKGSYKLYGGSSLSCAAQYGVSSLMALMGVSFYVLKNLFWCFH